VTADVPVLLLTGPVGVGKTTVAGELSDLLNALNIPHAAIDFDALRWCYPAPVGDPFRIALGFKNFAAVWANHRAAGAGRLILADVMETNDDLPKYEAAVPGAAIIVVRLRASLPTLVGRVERRELGAGRKWHIRRAAELSEIMERNGVGGFVVETDDTSTTAVAREVARRTGWLAALPA